MSCHRHKYIKHAMINGDILHRCTVCGHSLTEVPLKGDPIFAKSDLKIPCPNCQQMMKKKYLADGISTKWVCLYGCENATDMSKDIMEISKGSTTGIKRRWLVPGSGTMKYTVAEWESEYQGQLFSCACPAWTRHTPRADCKHILRVKKEKVGSMDYAAMMQKYKEDAAAIKLSNVKYTVSYGYTKPQPIKLKKIMVPTPEPPKPKTVTVVVPTHVPKTEGRKFR